MKFTIIVPTKNRADTLYWALRTCVEQKYQNLTIIVSDNFSTDNTKDVALCFNDARIKYINTGTPLSMSGNWEFALSHVEEGYVTFLGDDDAFLPDAISKVNEIAHEKDYDAINNCCIEYNWPNHVNPMNRNKMYFIRNNVETHPDVRELLPMALRCELPYSALPWLYKGFVSVALLKKIKETSPLFFNSRNPDIYSAIAIATVIRNKKYYYSQTPFAINGASSHSNGVSQATKIKNAGAIEFLSSLSIPFHKDLVLSSSIPIYIYECYLQVKDAGLLKNADGDPVQLVEVLEKAMEFVQYSNKDMYQKVKEAIEGTGAKNNIEEDTLKVIINKYPNRNILSKAANKTKNRYFSDAQVVDMNEYKVKNVYDAAYIANKILKNEIIPTSANAIRSIAKDIKTIFKKTANDI